MMFKKLSLFMTLCSLLLITPLYSSEKQGARLNRTREWLTGRNIGWTAVALSAVAAAGGWAYKKWLEFKKLPEKNGIEKKDNIGKPNPRTTATPLQNINYYQQTTSNNNNNDQGILDQHIENIDRNNENDSGKTTTQSTDDQPTLQPTHNDNIQQSQKNDDDSQEQISQSTQNGNTQKAVEEDSNEQINTRNESSTNEIPEQLIKNDGNDNNDAIELPETKLSPEELKKEQERLVISEEIFFTLDRQYIINKHLTKLVLPKHYLLYNLFELTANEQLKIRNTRSKKEVSKSTNEDINKEIEESHIFIDNNKQRLGVFQTVFVPHLIPLLREITDKYKLTKKVDELFVYQENKSYNRSTHIGKLKQYTVSYNEALQEAFNLLRSEKNIELKPEELEIKKLLQEFIVQYFRYYQPTYTLKLINNEKNNSVKKTNKNMKKNMKKKN